MYPQRELTRLGAHKASLQYAIALRRAECAEAAVRVAQPFMWLDRALDVWRRLAPFAQAAAVPLGLLAARTVFRRANFLRSLVRWGPLVWAAARRVGSVAKTRRGTSKSTGTAKI